MASYLREGQIYPDHGEQCTYSSNQSDWCYDCQHQWIARAHWRFCEGWLITMGVPVTVPYPRPS